MKRNQAIILAVCGVILLGLLLSYLLDRPPTPKALFERALSASSPEARQQAVQRLVQIKGGEILPYLRRLVAESQDPDVILTALQGISLFGDQDSLPVLIDAMNHPDKPVREQAAYVVLRIFGEAKLPQGIEYNPEDDSEDRLKSVHALKRILAEKQTATEKAALEKHKRDEKK